MKKAHKILLAAASGIVLVGLAWIWMAKASDPVSVLGVVPGLIGILMLSYVVFQINEGLLALFWGVLFLLAARFWLGVGDIDFLIILFMVIPGVDLLGFGTWLLFKPRKRQ